MIHKKHTHIHTQTKRAQVRIENSNSSSEIAHAHTEIYTTGRQWQHARQQLRRIAKIRTDEQQASSRTYTFMHAVDIRYVRNSSTAATAQTQIDYHTMPCCMNKTFSMYSKSCIRSNAGAIPSLSV